MSEYLLTYLWALMECFASVILFDAFSERRWKPLIHWTILICFVIVHATLLNWATPLMSSFWKFLFVLASHYLLHRLLHVSNRIFCLYIAMIFYATICCVDNLVFTFTVLILNQNSATGLGSSFALGFLTHCFMIVVCYLQKFFRKSKAAMVANWKWYTVPVLLSFVSVLIIFFLGDCFLQGILSVQPLCVCAAFITAIQVAALFLVSWMEQNAHFREKALSLQTKSLAQQESIEALSAAYAQQRKLTHDSRAHVDTLSAMLAQEPPNLSAARAYLRSLQTAQTSRILLVNTHHAALDALLNQKALLARNRKIDVQFQVNDLSSVRIDMVDLTIIISNTLDNAIEACEKLPVDDRQIHVQVLLEEDELFYAVRNRSLPVEAAPDRLPVTTKENPSFHGFGLQNVQSTLKKYNSVYAMNYADGWFEFATDLPNTPVS